eukprot:TRINITY_DN27347_c0_g1_i1.p1 TRINITY_DN27347_c0_g1~~TRINITY_DN27347_c0_g1_i1.p1  ORF type:complete len:268 (+),score=55.50 TRINITY_DN27347_c0_g1_i1:64-867(+)
MCIRDSLNPDQDKAFWDFSFQQMGQFDLPAMFQYISNITHRERISYVGVSQGATQMFAALADRVPGVVSRIEVFIALAPAVFLKHIQAPLHWLIAKSNAYKLAGIFQGPEIKAALGERGGLAVVVPGWDFIFDLMTSTSRPSVDNLKKAYLFDARTPSSTSLQAIMHFAQLTNSNNVFQKFDYGTKENLQRYGQKKPPVYNLAQITERVHIFAGAYDVLAVLKDVQTLQTKLQNATLQTYPMGHGTFKKGLSMACLLYTSPSPRDQA